MSDSNAAYFAVTPTDAMCFSHASWIVPLFPPVLVIVYFSTSTERAAYACPSSPGPGPAKHRSSCPTALSVC